MKDLLLAILSSSALTLFLKAFSKDSENRYGILLGNYIACTMLAFLTAREKSVMFVLSKEAVILGILAGIFFLLGLLAIQAGVIRNGAALTSAFSKLGMTVPLLLSVLLFHERLRLTAAAGILLAVGAIFVVYYDPAGKGGTAASLLLFTLLANGIADSFAKLFEVFCTPAEENGYLFLVFLTAAILTLLLFLRERKTNGKTALPKTFLFGMLAGIPNYFSSLFLLHALGSLPAVFVYPVFSVGAILTVMVLSILLFREHLNTYQKAGLFLVILALILLYL